MLVGEDSLLAVVGFILVLKRESKRNVSTKTAATDFLQRLCLCLSFGWEGGILIYGKRTGMERCGSNKKGRRQKSIVPSVVQVRCLRVVIYLRNGQTKVAIYPTKS